MAGLNTSVNILMMGTDFAFICPPRIKVFRNVCHFCVPFHGTGIAYAVLLAPSLTLDLNNEADA